MKCPTCHRVMPDTGLHYGNGMLMREGKKEMLTRGEDVIFAEIYKHRPQFVPIERIQYVYTMAQPPHWNRDAAPTPDVCRVMIMNARRKLDRIGGGKIIARHGYGYSFIEVAA